MNGLMIVGTDTGVGKTMLCELLLVDARKRGTHVGVYKPVCTGSERDSSGAPTWSDIERLHEASGRRWDRDAICPQKFQMPAAPPVAAAAEGRIVDEMELRAGLDRWRQQTDTLIVEGVGGLLCPVSDRLTIADLANQWSMPIVVVSANRLGTINHTLLTLEVAERRGLNLAGWVLNQPQPGELSSSELNVGEIRKHSNVPYLGEIGFASDNELQTGQSLSRIFSGSGVRFLADILTLAREIVPKHGPNHLLES